MITVRSINLLEQKFTGERLETMTTGNEDGKLTKDQVSSLAVETCIATRHVEVLATQFLRIGAETVETLRKKHAEDPEAFKRDVLWAWAERHPEENQVQVRDLGSTSLFRQTFACSSRLQTDRL